MEGKRPLLFRKRHPLLEIMSPNEDWRAYTRMELLWANLFGFKLHKSHCSRKDRKRKGALNSGYRVGQNWFHSGEKWVTDEDRLKYLDQDRWEWQNAVQLNTRWDDDECKKKSHFSTLGQCELIERIMEPG